MGREYEHLTPLDLNCLKQAVADQEITERHLPDGALGMDSMGPMRNPKTNTLYHGTEDALGRFAETLVKYGDIFVVATNGPDEEGEDILRALPSSVTAIAVTEGGGRFISKKADGQFEYKILADAREVGKLNEIEVYLSENPLIRAMLDDNNSQDGIAPIRTPYYTNTVLTLPEDIRTLYDRFRHYGFRLDDFIPGVNSDNYVNSVLSYAQQQFGRAIKETRLEDNISVMVKPQNRRIYVLPDHLYDGRRLSKRAGAELGSNILYGNKLAYKLQKSVYVADRVVTVSNGGSETINPSEMSMIKGMDNDGIPRRCRSAVNVTMNGSQPRVYAVEGVPILDIGSGKKALEAISFLRASMH